MKHKFILSTVLFAIAISANAQPLDCSAGWEKYGNNPVLGGNIGSIYDVSVLKTDSGYQMYSSLYNHNMGIALSQSSDGLEWTNPSSCLNFNYSMENKSWEKFGNRSAIVIKNGEYHMWYSGQDASRSCIGYAVSPDGKIWTKKSTQPVLLPEAPWEELAVQSPHVIWDGQEQLFKMWYSAGERMEPGAIGYATSKDGLHWEKYKNNPVFIPDKQNQWEQAKVSGCQVIKRKNDYLMFYVGYSNADHAQIGMARSKDGITNWERFNQNPIVKPGTGWDSYAVYMPWALPDPENNRWLLYYNGRRGWHEQLGVVIHQGMDVKF